MQDAMIKAAEAEYGCSAVYADLPDVPQELKDKYASEEWRLGTRIPFEKELIHRFSWGEAEVQLSMKGGYIKDCRIYSDSLETEVFGLIEELLRGCRYDASAVRSLELPGGTAQSARELLSYIADSI
jgi:lipoate-protein ligase A